jgi:hypothetical protein
MEKLLSTLIAKHFFVSSATIKLIVQIVLALIHVRDVNLTVIALAICGEAQTSSGYRKLQRFFAAAEFCLVSVAKLIVQIAGLGSGKWTLIIDRTNWKFGQKHLNILVLSIEQRGIAIPVLWSMLDNNGGNSNREQREALLSKFIRIFGSNQIEKFLADREFIGDEWLRYLANNGIKFYIRIRSDLTIGRSENELVTANSMVKKLKNSETIILKGDRYLGQNYQGPKVRIAAMRNEKGELVIIATNDKPEQALEVYRQRWAIETLFGCLKTRGFNFENTHIAELARIEKLLALLAIAFTICHIVGIWRHEIQPIKLKTHQRKAVSLFRYGLDYLRQILLQPLYLARRIREIAHIFRLQTLYN